MRPFFRAIFWLHFANQLIFDKPSYLYNGDVFRSFVIPSDSIFFYLFQEKAKGPENEIAKMEKLLSLVREPSAKN